MDKLTRYQKKYEKLTPHQEKVAKKLAEGMSNKELADCLGLTEKGVKFHVTNILKKTGFKGERRQKFVYNFHKYGTFFRADK